MATVRRNEKTARLGIHRVARTLTAVTAGAMSNFYVVVYSTYPIVCVYSINSSVIYKLTVVLRLFFVVPAQGAPREAT